MFFLFIIILGFYRLILRLSSPILNNYKLDYPPIFNKIKSKNPKNLLTLKRFLQPIFSDLLSLLPGHNIQDDPSVLYKSLNKHRVRYLVIGGISAVLHGVPRTTLDIDILIDPTRNNTSNLLKALLEAGLHTASLTSVDDVLAHEISIFKDIIRLDVQTKTRGVNFKKAWKRKVLFKVTGKAWEAFP